MSFLRCFSFLLGIFFNPERLRFRHEMWLRCEYVFNGVCCMAHDISLWRSALVHTKRATEYKLDEESNDCYLERHCESLSHRDISLLSRNFGMVLKFEMNRGGKCPNFEIICLDQRLDCSNGQPRRANLQIRARCIVGREG